MKTTITRRPPLCDATPAPRYQHQRPTRVPTTALDSFEPVTKLPTKPPQLTLDFTGFHPSRVHRTAHELTIDGELTGSIKARVVSDGKGTMTVSTWGEEKKLGPPVRMTWKEMEQFAAAVQEFGTPSMFGASIWDEAEPFGTNSTK